MPFAVVTVAAMAIGVSEMRLAGDGAGRWHQALSNSVEKEPEACDALREWSSANSGRARTFGATGKGWGYEPRRATWREYLSQESLDDAAAGGNLYYVAKVWTASDHGLLVRTEQRSFSDDWRLFVDYCFRPSGGIAVVSSELFYWPSETIALQTVQYDQKGHETQRREGSYEIKDGRDPKAPDGEASVWMRRNLVVYRRAADLPFHRMLSLPKSNR